MRESLLSFDRIVNQFIQSVVEMLAGEFEPIERGPQQIAEIVAAMLGDHFGDFLHDFAFDLVADVFLVGLGHGMILSNSSR